MLSKTTKIAFQITNIDGINQTHNVWITKWYAKAATANIHDKNNDTLFTEREARYPRCWHSREIKIKPPVQCANKYLNIFALSMI